MVNNIAVRSARALNSFLNLHWEDAKDIVENTQPGEIKDRSSCALREFELGRRSLKHSSLEDLPFRVVFSAPSLEYICSHEVALFLTVESGHINPAYQPDGLFRIDSSKNKVLENLDLAYRIQFNRCTLAGRDECANYPETPHPVPVVVLHLNTASLVTQELPINKELLQSCMRRFLDALSTNGDYILYDTPKIDNWLPVSYSTNHSAKVRGMLEASDYKVSIHGFDVEEINGHYKHLWEGSKTLEDYEHWTPDKSSELLLTAYCSDWLPVDNGLGDIDSIGPFVITFGVPKLTALCPHELILTFNIVELYLLDPERNPDDSDPTNHVDNWQISFIVSIRAVEGSHGVVELDLGSDPTVYKPLTQLGTQDTEENCRIVLFIIRFFTLYYLRIFKENGYPQVPHPWEPPEEPDVSPTLGPSDYPHGYFYTSPQDFDHVATLSEWSVNQIFSHRDQRSTIDIPGLFDARILSVYIRLVPPNSAIIYIRFSGSMALESPPESAPRKSWIRPQKVDIPNSPEGKTKEPFGSIELAFEVKLKMISGSELIHQLDHDVRDTFFPTGHSQFETKHLILDFRTASYSNLNSNISALELNPNKLAIARHHISDHLRSLVSNGHHILYSVRLAKDDSGEVIQGQPDGPFSFREISHQVVIPYWSPSPTGGVMEDSIPELPIIAIYGNCLGDKRKASFPLADSPLPLERRQITWGSIGTISFSQEALLKGILLPCLADLNVNSTIMAVLPESLAGGDLRFEFEMWQGNNTKQFAAWKASSRSTGRNLEYEWHHSKEVHEKSVLRAEEDSSAEIIFQSLSDNRLAVPTDDARALTQLVVLVEGTSEITFGSSSKLNTDEDWRYSSTVSWSCSIAIDTSESGLQVSTELTCTNGANTTSGRPTNFSSRHCEIIRESQFRLKDNFETELRSALAGPWEHCTLGRERFGLRMPGFTRDGDFRCELDVV